MTPAQSRDELLEVTDSDGNVLLQFTLRIWFHVNLGTPETGRGYLADPALYDPGEGESVTLVGAALVDETPQFLAPEDWRYPLAQRWCEVHTEDLCADERDRRRDVVDDAQSRLGEEMRGARWSDDATRVWR